MTTRTTKRMTVEQAKWCVRYQNETGFDALMDDFKAGNESFIHAARKSVKWFEDWSNDVLHSIDHGIPGEL